MALKPEASVMAALATGTVVYAIYSKATPTLADVRSVDAMNQDLDSAERQATWTAAAVCAGISLVTRDPGPFILGGLMTIALAWSHRHANMVNPLTGRAVATGQTIADMTPAVSQQDNPGAYGYVDDAGTESVI